MLPDELRFYLQAGTPMVWIQTFEEARYAEIIRREYPNRIFCWNTAEGLVGTGSKSRSAPVNMLEHIRSAESPDGIYLLHDFQHYIENPHVIRLLMDFAEEARRKGDKSVVFICPEMTVPGELEKELVTFTAELPDSREIYTYLTRTVDHMVKSGIITDGFARRTELLRTIQHLKGLTLNQIDDVLAYSVLKHNRIDPEEVLRQKINRLSHDSIIEIKDWRQCPSFEQIGGLNRLKQWLVDRKTVFLDAETRKSYRLPLPKGVLLTGVQGNGKSFIAQACAREWKLPLVSLELGRVFNSRVGASEANIRKVLKMVESMQPALLFIDEFEKGFSGVQSAGMSDGGTASRVFGTFLTWLQEHPSQVFVIATTNEISVIPPEVIRKGRFDEIFFIDLPAGRERAKIFALYLKKHKLYHLIPAVEDSAALSVGYTAAEIRQVVVNTVYEAITRKVQADAQMLKRNLMDLIPLSVTRGEELERLRAWSRGRCLSASSPEFSAEDTDESENVDLQDQLVPTSSPNPESGHVNERIVQFPNARR
jgi:ATP-dependent 26S proteasome regulatory subunit